MSPCSVETVGETPQPWGAATSASDLMTVKLEKMSAVSAGLINIGDHAGPYMVSNIYQTCSKGYS